MDTTSRLNMCQKSTVCAGLLIISIGLSFMTSYYFSDMYIKITYPESYKSLAISNGYNIYYSRANNTGSERQNKTNSPNEQVVNSVEICSQEERKQYFQHMCDVIQNRNQRPRAFLVDHEHKVTYCYVPKIASTSWKELMAASTTRGKAHNQTENVHEVRIHRPDILQRYGLSTVPMNQLQTLKGYTNFAIVRHPFDRAVSAYADKMLHTGYFQTFQNVVKKHFREETQPFKDPVSFLEFVRYLTEGNAGNPHWRSYMPDCNPCVLDFDYILRVETLEHDSPNILKKINQTLDFFNTNKANVNREGNETIDGKVFPKYLKAFKSIDEEHVISLYQKYRLEFEQFGYTYNHTTKMAYCKVTLPSGKVCC